MKTTFFASTMVLMIGLASVASAQTYGVQSVHSSGFGSGFGHSGYGGYGYGYHSSTFEEGVLRGFADLTRAHGDAAYMHSLAAINRQEANAKYLQNREAATETYFRMQQINKAARQAARPQRLTHEEYTALAKKMAPEGLTDQQYDRTLGIVDWPAVLNNEVFSSEREALNTLFSQRTPGDTGVSSAFSLQVARLTKSMQHSLQSHMDELNQMEYLAAKKFLTGLALEAQQPLVQTAVAAAE